MAEAEVAEVRGHTTFFCYTCNVRFRHIQEEDFTCPTCGGGFVEEVPEEEMPLSDGNPFQDSAAALVSSFLGGHGGPGHGHNAQHGGPPQFFDMLFGGFPGGSRGQVDVGGRSQSGSGHPNVRHTATGVTFTMGPGHGGHEDPMDQMFQSFLSNLVVSLGGQGAAQQQGQGNMFGNLGDYVWGRDGLDAIVTQLMNQMEGTGPPPLDSAKLERLRVVKIEKEHVDMKLECSVCWDDFHLDEEVKQLDCEHLYHPNCIIPWLKLHGTCPICRRDFTEGTAPGTTCPDAPDPSSAPPVQPNTSNPMPPTDTDPNRTRPFDMDMEFD